MWGMKPAGFQKGRSQGKILPVTVAWVPTRFNGIGADGYGSCTPFFIHQCAMWGMVDNFNKNQIDNFERQSV